MAEYSQEQWARATAADGNWLEAPVEGGLPGRLPVRLPMDAEVPLTARFMDEHGDDPQDWPVGVELQYAAAVAALRERWLRGEVQ